MKDITEQDVKNNIPLVCGASSWHSESFFIAGPCTVESYNQMDTIVTHLKTFGINYIRGGAYKPLTFPYRNENMYELGEKALEIFDDIKSKHDNVAIVSELTHVKNYDRFVKSVDVIQIGSRNMYNYELLECVSNAPHPVLLKRHFGASLRDWLGATEYLLQNNPRVILCERGITAPHTHQATSRFIADIQVIPMVKKYTGLPIIFDPSHSTFDRTLVPVMSQAAIAAGADGLLVETHPQPEHAAVDRLNAITIEDCGRLFQTINKGQINRVI
jgi:3-deoxy-7-phosphoheptulonate synthase